MIEVLENDDVIRSAEYRKYRNRLLSSQEICEQAYDNFYASMVSIDRLWELRNKLMGFGLLGVLIADFVEEIAEMKMICSKCDLSAALWEAKMEKKYAERQWEKYRGQYPYHPEVNKAMLEERQRIAERIQRMITDVREFENEKNRVQQASRDKKQAVEIEACR